jgi:hypothetical protein
MASKHEINFAAKARLHACMVPGEQHSYTNEIVLSGLYTRNINLYRPTLFHEAAHFRSKFFATCSPNLLTLSYLMYALHLRYLVDKQHYLAVHK